MVTGNNLPQYLFDQELVINVLKIFALSAFSFGVAFFITPFLTKFLYKHKLWKKSVREKSIDGKDLKFFKKFHEERETKVPRMGGILIWTVPLLTAVVFLILAQFDFWVFRKLNFLSRSQTWLPFFALITGSVVGLIDDILQVKGKGKYIGGGLSLKKRLILMFFIGLLGAWWFYYKLGWRTLNIPLFGDLYLGILYIPFFILVMMATYAGGVIDGLDGLAGSAFATIFGAYGAIAFFGGYVDLAAFCGVIAGAILAFLWFNIPPARFYMGESGIMGLCAALTVVAFLSDAVLVLPIIAILIVVEAGSVILQLLSKKYLKRKIFLASPIHHHFEAKGWPHYKITMRFSVIGIIAAIVGIAIHLLG